MTPCIDLRGRFWTRYPIRREADGAAWYETPESERVWLLELPCRYGVVYPQGGDLLAAVVTGRLMRQRVASRPCILSRPAGDTLREGRRPPRMAAHRRQTQRGARLLRVRLRGGAPRGAGAHASDGESRGTAIAASITPRGPAGERITRSACTAGAVSVRRMTALAVIPRKPGARQRVLFVRVERAIWEAIKRRQLVMQEACGHLVTQADLVRAILHAALLRWQ